MGEVKKSLVGMCAFCKFHRHDFPDDSWHWMKHSAGWHGCAVYGGFRFRMPKCEMFQIDDGSVFSA